MAEPHDESVAVAKLSFGFNRTACDLDRAIAFARLAPLEQFLLTEARLESWTRATLLRASKPFLLRFNLSAIAKATGLERSNLSRALAALVSARIFLKTGDGAYLINKDYRTWLASDGTSLLRAEHIDLCLALRKGSGPMASISGIEILGVSQTTQPCVDNDTPPVSTTTQLPCRKRHTPCVDNDTPPALTPPHPPVGERASERISEDLRISSSNSRDAPTVAPLPGPKADHPDLARLVAWADVALAEGGADEFVRDDFSRLASDWLAHGYAASAIKDFVVKAIAKRALAPLRFGRFVQACLARLADDKAALPSMPKGPAAPARPFYTARPRPQPRPARNGDGHPRDGGDPR